MVDISIQKTRDDYNKIAKHFSDTRNMVWAEMEKFIPLIKKGQNILDWGCGAGRFLFLLENKNVNYFGVDLSEKSLQIAKKRWSKLAKTGVAKFFCNAKKDKKFQPNFFDLVFMFASFHHLPDKKSRLAVLKKVYYETKANGRLIITVWNLESDWAKKKLDKDYKKIGENDYLVPWKDGDGNIEVERFYHHFSLNELKELLIEAGYRVEKISYFNQNTFSKDKKNSRNLVAVALKK